MVDVGTGGMMCQHGLSYCLCRFVVKTERKTGAYSHQLGVVGHWI